MIIAVDGPAGSGKGTLAQRLAAHYGLRHLDTGKCYRAVAAAMRSGGAQEVDVAAAVEAARAVDFADLADPALEAADIGEGASRIAVLPELRAVLVERQRAFARAAAREGPGVVLDGRDIGTVVCPDADIKLFVTASLAARARRRSLQLYGAEDGPRYEEVLRTLQLRDARDRDRAASPLRPAPDARLLDTTDLTPEASFLAAAALVDAIRAN